MVLLPLPCRFQLQNQADTQTPSLLSLHHSYPTPITHLHTPSKELPPSHQCWFATVALRYGHGIHCESLGNTCTSSVNSASHAKKHWQGLSRKESLDAVVAPIVIRNKHGVPLKDYIWVFEMTPWKPNT